MSRTTLLFLACWAPFLAFAGRSAGADQILPAPRQGHFTEADLEAARQQSISPLPPPADWEGAPPAEATPSTASPSLRLNDDNDTAHTLRGTTLVVHIFIDHTEGVWTVDEMNSAAARAQTAKNWLQQTGPFGANIHFDHDGGNGYFYVPAELSYAIPPDGMTYGMMNEILTGWGFVDVDGDGAIIDDYTFFLQNWAGGWDNVITCWEPRQSGRSWAAWDLAYTFIYFNQSAGVFGHEWGHIFGACDEYVENGHCGGGTDCGQCSNQYLTLNTDNGNCALAGCAQNTGCVMKYNTWDLCGYTHDVWGWRDEDGNGILDDTRRRVSGSNFVLIHEVPHRANFGWNVVTDGMVISQRWNSWAVVGLRSPYTADYDLSLYGDNNHNLFYAGSAMGAGDIDLIVGDYNHSSLGNENIGLTHYSGSWDSYELFFDSGPDMIYADGIPRPDYWNPLEVVRVWDLPLFAGERVSIDLDVQSPTLDLGMALFRSSGAPYWTGRAGAVWEADASGLGGFETYTYTVPADDVYGLVLFANTNTGGNFTLRIGGVPVTLAEETTVGAGGDLQLYNYDPNAPYWSFVGIKPAGDTDMRVGLYDDPNYQTPLAQAQDAGIGGMEILAADYNHAPLNRDYVRVVRTYGGGNHMIEWEHDPDILSGMTVGSWWTQYNLGKIWDAYLRAGQPYFLRQYHPPGSTMDTGAYLFSSAGGDLYKTRTQAVASSNSHPAGDGGEWFTYVPGQDDWYGVCMTVENNGTDAYSIWLGPKLSPAEGFTSLVFDPVVFSETPVYSNYWTVFAARGEGGGQANAWLYGDNAYTASTLLADDQSGRPVVYVVGDYNHSPMQAYYPRYLREDGGSMSLQWEGGADALNFVPGQTTTYDGGWGQGDVASMWDVYVNGSISGGQTVRFQVTDLSGTNDFAVAFFASNGAPYFGVDQDAVATADAAGPGGSEQITVHLTREDWYGLLVTSKSASGGGSYQVQVIDPVESSVPTPAAADFSLAVLSGNPFDSSIPIQYSLAHEGAASLLIYSVQGREVRRLLDGRRPSGTHIVRWDGCDLSGRPAACGVYFAKLCSGGDQRSIRLVRR